MGQVACGAALHAGLVVKTEIPPAQLPQGIKRAKAKKAVEAVQTIAIRRGVAGEMPAFCIFEIFVAVFHTPPTFFCIRFVRICIIPHISGFVKGFLVNFAANFPRRRAKKWLRNNLFLNHFYISHGITTPKASRHGVFNADLARGVNLCRSRYF